MSTKKIAILFGMENTFPPALVNKINSMKVEGITAEFVHIGGIRMDEPKKYDVIIDRISQDIPFYRAYLKNAMLQGSIIVNNRFWWTADDKFFNYAMAHKMGVAIPPHSHPAASHASARHHRQVNAQPDVPVELGRAVRLRGLPRVPQALFRRRLEACLQSPPEEFFQNYNQTGDLCMTVQHGVENF